MAQEKEIWGAGQEAVKEETVKFSENSVLPKLTEEVEIIGEGAIPDRTTHKPIVKTNKNRNTIVFVGLIVIAIFLVKKYLK